MFYVCTSFLKCLNEIQLCTSNFPSDVFVGISLRNKIIFEHCNAFLLTCICFPRYKKPHKCLLPYSCE